VYVHVCVCVCVCVYVNECARECVCACVLQPLLHLLSSRQLLIVEGRVLEDTETMRSFVFVNCIHVVRKAVRPSVNTSVLSYGLLIFHAVVCARGSISTCVQTYVFTWCKASRCVGVLVCASCWLPCVCVACFHLSAVESCLVCACVCDCTVGAEPSVQ
jgi:hypothetical protein